MLKRQPHAIIKAAIRTYKILRHTHLTRVHTLVLTLYCLRYWLTEGEHK